MSDTAPLAGALADDALRNLCYADSLFRQRYEGWECVGRGGFATVVKVRLMGEPVALKVFPQLSDAGRGRFRAEFANAVRLTSPNVVRTYSAFEHGSVAWIEMEIVEGRNLKQELERRAREADPLPLVQALEVARAVAGALAEAHDAQIVHRDIKPANILLPRSGKPIAKLGDFGIARFSGASKLTATGAFPGTPHFGAPEAFAGKPLGPPADVYSLSLCFYALFTNDEFPWPVDDDTALETLMAYHVTKAPRSMRQFAEVPEELDALILAGLDKRPSARPTAQDLLRGLDAIHARGVRGLGGGPSGRRGVLLGVAALLCVALAAAAVLRGKAVAPRSAPSPAVSPAPPAPPTPPPTPPPTVGVSEPPAPAVARPPGGVAGARIHGDFLRLVNGATTVSRVRVVLWSAGGTAHSLDLREALGPGETTEVPLEGLEPPPLPGARFREARVQAWGPGGVVEARFALP